jgi:cyclopropane fatty-acyl-phospholipid synthase-like methyltransferase
VGGFDAIWDRGALVAIGPELREKYLDPCHSFAFYNQFYNYSRYLKLMKSLLKPDGSYLIEGISNNDPDYEGDTGFSKRFIL